MRGQDRNEPPDVEEVEISFHGSSGKKKTIPVWFTLHQGKFELLPMYGTKSRWFSDIRESGSVELKVGNWTMTARPRTVLDIDAIDEIKGRFSAKYGGDQVKKYYPACDAAFEVTL